MFATAVASTCPELPAIHYTIGFLGGPVRVVPYATFGSPELADGLRAALAGRHGALLQNHGAVTVGHDVEEAYERARLLEWLAELYYRSSRLGSPRLLSPAELDAFSAQVAALSYGTNDGPPGPGRRPRPEFAGTSAGQATAGARPRPEFAGTAAGHRRAAGRVSVLGYDVAGGHNETKPPPCMRWRGLSMRRA